MTNLGGVFSKSMELKCMAQIIFSWKNFMRNICVYIDMSFVKGWDKWDK